MIVSATLILSTKKNGASLAKKAQAAVHCQKPPKDITNVLKQKFVQVERVKKCAFYLRKR